MKKLIRYSLVTSRARALHKYSLPTGTARIPQTFSQSVIYSGSNATPIVNVGGGTMFALVDIGRARVIHVHVRLGRQNQLLRQSDINIFRRVSALNWRVLPAPLTEDPNFRNATGSPGFSGTQW